MKYIFVIILTIILIYGVVKRWDEYTEKKEEDPNNWWNKNKGDTSGLD